MLLLETLLFLTGFQVKRFLGLYSAICQSRNVERTVAAGKRQYKRRSFLLSAFHAKRVNAQTSLTGFEVGVGYALLRYVQSKEIQPSGLLDQKKGGIFNLDRNIC